MQNHLVAEAFYNLKDKNSFYVGFRQVLNAVGTPNGTYFSDQLFTFHRNLSFLEDQVFVDAFNRNMKTPQERGVIWRNAVVLWGFRNGLRLEGDFVECACYRGSTARVMCEATDFGSLTDRRYYLYDLFEHDSSMKHHAMPAHSKSLYESVRARFADMPNVIVTQGKVPKVLDKVAPEKIAFMHLDLNNAGAELGALKILFERMVPGAIMVLDDYGWLAYREQKLAEDPWLLERGYRVLELPTGQGLVIR